MIKELHAQNPDLTHLVAAVGSAGTVGIFSFFDKNHSGFDPWARVAGMENQDTWHSSL